MPEADISEADLDRMTEEELINLTKAAVERLSPARLSEVIDAVGERRRAKEVEVKETLLSEFRQRAVEAGVSFNSLFGQRRIRADAGQPLAPKYRGPKGETWTGRGRQPRWLAELEGAGHNRDEFLIREESE